MLNIQRTSMLTEGGVGPMQRAKQRQVICGKVHL